MENINGFGHYQKWERILGVLLSGRDQPTFKIAQIIETGTGILFDLRQYLRGRSTKTGLTLPAAEFQWLKNCLQRTDCKEFNLEHGSRSITLKRFKDCNTLVIQVIRSDGSERSMNLTREETDILVANLDTLLAKILERSKELCYETEFKPFEYVWEKIICNDCNE